MPSLCLGCFVAADTGGCVRDHGFHMGQHRLAADKREPYETDIRIPFFAAGPGIAAGRTLPQVAGMVDLPPTILALAGVSPPSGADAFDGRSFAPLLRRPEPSGSGGGASLAVPEEEAAWDREEYLVAYMACSQTPKVNPSDGGHAKDTANNTFIGLRIINATADLAYYVEWRCFLDLSCCPSR